VPRLALAIAIVATLAARASADTIREIVVEGNTKTTTDTVQLIARIDVGDDWQAELQDKIEERLKSSGLFSSVETFWDAVPGGVRVHITVKDKHSWVIAPAVYDQPTNKGAGVGYGENNLFGENQKLLLYAQIATGESFFVGAWVIPSIADSIFYAQLDTYLRHSHMIEYAAPTSWIDNPAAVREENLNYLNNGLKLGIEPLRGIKLDTRLRGAYVYYSGVELASPTVTPAQVGAAPGAPVPPPGKRGWDVSNETMFTVDRRANWEGIYTGYRYQVSYETSVPGLSDFNYYKVGFSAYHARRVLEHHDLVVKGTLNVGHHLPFEQELLTGGTDMRGWLNYQFRGDFQAEATAEYSVPLFKVYGLSVRGLGFWDSAYTTFLTTDNPDRNYLPDSQARGLAPFKNSVGIGTRMFLQQIVIPLLGVDLGYGLEAKDFQIYLAVGLTD
jgi:outer membrane protein assembly factor BamA